LAGTTPLSIAVDHFKYWIHQDPSFDWHTVTEASFVTNMRPSIEKFSDVIGTDDNLKTFRKAGGKMITSHAPPIPHLPRGTYHYYNSVHRGDYDETQKFYRFFPYPNSGHCGGGTGPLIDPEALFAVLVNWVEHGVAPDYVVATSPRNLRGGRQHAASGRHSAQLRAMRRSLCACSEFAPRYGFEASGVRRHRRQAEVKGGAVRPVRGRPQPAPVRLDDRSGDRQPHAHPAWLGREERVEHVV